MISEQKVKNLRQHIRRWRAGGERIALVPTMGNLHEGHLKLVDRAHELADRVVVSLFVNPLQFGDGEDLDSYPRTLAQDCNNLVERNTDLLGLHGSREADLGVLGFACRSRGRGVGVGNLWVGREAGAEGNGYTGAANSPFQGPLEIPMAGKTQPPATREPDANPLNNRGDVAIGWSPTSHRSRRLPASTEPWASATA